MAEFREKITVFDAKDLARNKKVPISPYGDDTFTFRTIEVTSAREMFSVMAKFFILNIPLVTLEKPIRAKRRVSTLGNYIPDKITYVVLDIDDVHTQSSMNTILDYFRDKCCILGESKSHNGIDNFRLKGVLFLDGLTPRDAKISLTQIYLDLKDHCTIDYATTRRVSLNSPINKNKILLDNSKLPRYEPNLNDAQEMINRTRGEYSSKFAESNLSVFGENQGSSDYSNISTIEELCLVVFQNMGFEALEQNGEAVTFKHPTEKKTPGGYFWFSTSPYTMHHFNRTKTVNIFETVRKLPIAKEILNRGINYEKELKNGNIKSKVIEVNEKFLEVTPEVQGIIDEFIESKDGLFRIKSPMGTGKSTIIGKIITEAHDNDLTVLIITNRISVAQDFSLKYSLKLYNKDKYSVGDSLVLQYDSLWKYNIKDFDLIVMDEFISLMLHSRSNLSNSPINLGKFFGAFNKKLVIADAFLTGYENFLLKGKKDSFLLDNLYRDGTELLDYSDFNHFIQEIRRVTDSIMGTNKKVSISSTSLGVINELSLMLSSRGHKVVTLTADTPETTKEIIYELFNKEDHDKFDVVLFSPTLTVGVSNLNDVDDHFHYDSSMSSDVISSLQMVKRTRKSRRIHLFIRPRINYLRTTYNGIRDEYMQNLGSKMDSTYLFEIDNYGEPRLSKTGQKALRIDTFSNILEFNHREAFMFLSKYHFSNEPRIVDESFDGNILTPYKRELSSSKSVHIEQRLKEFLNLSDIELYNLENPDNSCGLSAKPDRLMQSLIDINNSIIEVSPDVKEEIFKACLKDREFLKKSRFFRALRNYSSGEIGTLEINALVHKAVMDSDDDSLSFYNDLVQYCSKNQLNLKEEYTPREVNQDKKLRSLLIRCGFYQSTRASEDRVGFRAFIQTEDVKNLWQYVI